MKPSRQSIPGSLLFAAILVLRALPVDGRATPLFVFTDSADFNAAAAALPYGTEVLTFDEEGGEDAAPGTTIASGSQFGGIAFVSLVGGDFTIDNQFEAVSGLNYLGPDDPLYNVFGPDNNLSLGFNPPLRALGMFFLTGGLLSPGEVEIVTPLGSAINGNRPSLCPQFPAFDDSAFCAAANREILENDYTYFLGVVSDGPAFSTAQIRFHSICGEDPDICTDSAFNIDGISMTPVPEPSSWALLLAGAAVLAVRVRRARRR